MIIPNPITLSYSVVDGVHYCEWSDYATDDAKRYTFDGALFITGSGPTKSDAYDHMVEMYNNWINARL